MVREQNFNLFNYLKIRNTASSRINTVCVSKCLKLNSEHLWFDASILSNLANPVISSSLEVLIVAAWELFQVTLRNQIYNNYGNPDKQIRPELFLQLVFAIFVSKMH